MDNLTNKTEAQLLGIAEGNLQSILSFVDMPEYQKEWVKISLKAVQQISYNKYGI